MAATNVIPLDVGRARRARTGRALLIRQAHEWVSRYAAGEVDLYDAVLEIDRCLAEAMRKPT